MTRYVKQLTCEESNKILDRKSGYPGWSVYASLTDPDGTYGEPLIRTIWEKNGRLIQDETFPDENNRCEHWEVEDDSDE